RAKLAAGAPDAAARAAVEKLRREGAQVIVALLGMTRAEARGVMNAAPGIAFGVIGADVGEGMPEAEPAGGGFLVAPADLLRRAARIDLHVRGGLGPCPEGRVGCNVALAPFEGKAQCDLRCQRLAKKIADLDAQLAAWAKDPSADRAFVAAPRKERDDAAAEKHRLETAPPAPPSTRYF